ncbi:hypothetical protein ZWY2020_021627 [Hordeum vulgare]|nr:hypothetical protein ZWY2020_021627 [Hordeum vulgare]
MARSVDDHCDLGPPSGDKGTDGGVADMFVEYNGEQDEAEEEESVSDFEAHELDDLMNNVGEEDPDAVVTSQEETLCPL